MKRLIQIQNNILTSEPNPNMKKLKLLQDDETGFVNLDPHFSMMGNKILTLDPNPKMENQNIPDPNPKIKKLNNFQDDDEIQDQGATGFFNLDENLLFEVLKHVDARTLGRAACVSRQWNKTTQDERLWELICTRHWANIGCGNHQLRSVVLALGGFRRLHSQYLWPLSKPQSGTSPSSWAKFPPILGGKAPARWGKDEVHLSLSLLSIRYYEKMNFSNRNR
ncbi:F-box protein GID2 [Euphorbia peplus]|nr:F-box protein GID2 [Euphorbia peplus]